MSIASQWANAPVIRSCVQASASRRLVKVWSEKTTPKPNVSPGASRSSTVTSRPGSAFLSRIAAYSPAGPPPIETILTRAPSAAPPPVGREYPTDAPQAGRPHCDAVPSQPSGSEVTMDAAAGGAFALDPAQERLVDEVRALAREELLPLAAAGRPGRVNRALVAALGDHGLLPRLFPRELGGAADGPASAMTLCLLREALARESTEAETALALQALGAYPILTAGGEALKRRFPPAVASGQAVAAFALSEAGAGSDAAALELRAEPDGDGFRLTGAKQWISNAPDADVYTVFARTTPGARARGVTAFAVPGNAPGMSGQALDLLAPHPVGRLSFDGVGVAAEQVLGAVDGGFAVGMAQAALDLAVQHAATRRSFGRPLRDFQPVSHRLAEMATRTQAARLLVYAAASRYDAGGAGVTAASAMAKLYATETAQAVVDTAVQVHGALALERGHRLEHLYREVRAPRIYEGTSEIQREVIARELFGGHPSAG